MLTSLENDPTQLHLVGRIHTALDALEADPDAAGCRRRRFASIGLWGIPIISNDEEWLILWEPGGEDEVVIQAITPAP